MSEYGIEIDTDYCGTCRICSSLCPFDAIDYDEERKEMLLDIEKCQMCGICYSSCPAAAIKCVYYDVESLERYIKDREEETLVIACKGSIPTEEKIKEITGLSEFISLILPCVGRVRVEFILRAISAGKRVILMPCEEDYCRFGEGSRMITRKFILLRSSLQMFGYPQSIVILRRNVLRVSFDRYKCIGCGNCEAFCPYDAVHLESPGVASFDLDACMGCGICAAICPAFAIELEGSERDSISAEISEFLHKEQERKILVFGCKWCEYASLDGHHLPEGVHFIELPCAGRMDRLHILQALRDGADGVLIAACPEEECKLEEGSKRAKENLSDLKDKLDQIGLGERVNICSASPKYVGQFDEELQMFMDRIKVG
jgi:coenzyme F420-reducing hydrogenase delta subunit/Pyruvate/2-oxoacid:ferredoxin oxidoreductase delta subunit